jgi:hypothetical protein
MNGPTTGNPNRLNLRAPYRAISARQVRDKRVCHTHQIRKRDKKEGLERGITSDDTLANRPNALAGLTFCALEAI